MNIATLAALAALFHDFGKSSDLFQQQLADGGYQPARHEWVSLRMFAAFVQGRPDPDWIAALASSDYSTSGVLANLPGISNDNPLAGLPPVAAAVGWLIVSHHRLPTYQGDNAPPLSTIATWKEKQLCRRWGYDNGDDFTSKEIAAFGTYSHGLPTDCPVWRDLAARIGKRALNAPRLSGGVTGRLTLHSARLALMLADHHISSMPQPDGATGPLWANTDRETGALRQPLSWHLCAVTRAAYLIGNNLHRVPALMPSISDHAPMATHTQIDKFAWQNRAYDAAAEANPDAGFFGVSLASTGCGKTFANARIMYALSPDRCRFSVALGLRSLTLQTGDALAEKLHLQSDDIAVAVGGDGVKELHAMRSDSGSDELMPDAYVKYAGRLASPRLARVAATDRSLNKLLSAPVLVSTIDHLMPASESLRGGRQIAALLRLMTSDLVLDEPDDFGEDDQHAVCRLINFAAMCGARVLLSSATILPAQAMAAFDAYRAGRAEYARATGASADVQCAFFDEFQSEVVPCAGLEAFRSWWSDKCDERIYCIRKAPVLRRAAIAEVSAPTPAQVIKSVSDTIRHGVQLLHGQHHQIQRETGKRVSIGIVRFANIQPLIEIARELMNTPAPQGWRFHFCVYHSQHPLIVRSHIESRLDATLTRYDQAALFEQPEIAAALELPEENQVFIVLATSVAEVGRDWDADWAMAEPSSSRALVQLAGRVQRHRQRLPASANLLILSHNINALRGRKPAYCRPGSESEDFRLPSHDMRELLLQEHYEKITSIPRLHRCGSALADLEHYRMSIEMFGSKKKPDGYRASSWWKEDADWSGELQRRKPFRASTGDEMTLFIDRDSVFYAADRESEKESSDVTAVGLELATGNQIWLENNLAGLFDAVAGATNIPDEQLARVFGTVTLPLGDKLYHPALGLYKDQ
ncbi:type I-F CRISPR-associated helicase Cas3f [Enterobacter roggenkampii]|uniref:type I-F CRISPR-associated helicase Cas3f n=1 Tax=Enterobacter roggenkampii TaxID=1812935 RepID=UPI003EC0F0A9